MSTTIRLVFWVFGDNCDRTTSVRIALDKDIGDLKEAIKEKKKSLHSNMLTPMRLTYGRFLFLSTKISSGNWTRSICLSERYLVGRSCPGSSLKSPTIAWISW